MLFRRRTLTDLVPLLSTVDDLASLDPELYHGLMILKNFTGDVESELSLNFTVTDEGMSTLSSQMDAGVVPCSHPSAQTSGFLARST